jgi:tRNA uridine 5-carboxymethylaminomethyl modification enzyme
VSLSTKKITPTEKTQEILKKMGTPPILKQVSLADLLKRVEVDYEMLVANDFAEPTDEEVFESVEVEIKYEGYISRQKELISIAKKVENMKIPHNLEYFSVRGLSREEMEKLDRIKPLSIGQAQRISGVNPSAIQAILIYLKLHRPERANHAD